MFMRTLQLSGEKDVNNNTIIVATEITTKNTWSVFEYEDRRNMNSKPVRKMFPKQMKPD